MVNIEKKTKWILSAVFLVAFIGLVATSYGRTDFVFYTFAVLSILFGLALWSEGGWINWLAKKGYKSWSSDDFFVIASFVFGTILVVNGILLFPIIGNQAPTWLISFIRPVVGISALIGLILTFWFLWSPKPKVNN